MEITSKQKSTAGEQFWQTQMMEILSHFTLTLYGRFTRIVNALRGASNKLSKPPLMTGGYS